MLRLLGCVGIVGVLVAAVSRPASAHFTLPTLNVTDCSSPIVSISTAEAGGVLGFDFVIGFESAVVAIAEVTMGDLTEACSYASNDTVPGEVRISIACTPPVFGGGSVAEIHFVPVGEGSTALSFDDCVVDEEPCSSSTPGNLTISGCPQVDLSNGGSGAFGRSPGRACVTGTLSSDGAAIASTQTTINFPSPSLGIEACSINPALSPLGKSLSRTVLGPGSERITISGGANAMPTGMLLLFTCRFTIASSLSGSFELTNTSIATDTGGTAVPTEGQNGAIGVTSCVGDCDGNGLVEIGEVVKALNAFSGNYVCSETSPSASCPAADSDNTGTVAIPEVVQTLNQFSAGPCP